MARAIAIIKDLRECGYAYDEIVFELEDAGFDDLTITVAMEMA